MKLITESVLRLRNLLGFLLKTLQVDKECVKPGLGFRKDFPVFIFYVLITSEDLFSAEQKRTLTIISKQRNALTPQTWFSLQSMDIQY